MLSRRRAPTYTEGQSQTFQGEALMRRARTVLAVTLVLFAASLARPQPADLRERFGTRSLEAARQLAEAIRLAQSKKHKDALTAVNAAIKADPQFQMGYYWKGI